MVRARSRVRSPVLALKKVLILGAGFGGLYVARHLGHLMAHESAEITIIDRRNHFLFTPLLHEVAAATIDESQPVEPIPGFINQCRIKWQIGEVAELNANTREVKLQDGRTFPYDLLVVALGSTTNFHNVIGAKQFSYPLKEVAEASAIRRQIIGRLEAAQSAGNPATRKRLLSFVIVGGGPTGVELAGEISDLMRDSRRYFGRGFSAVEVSLTLIHNASTLLNQFKSPPMSRFAELALREKGWQVLLNETVVEVTAQGVRLVSGRQLESETVIWLAGVTPVPLTTLPPFAKDSTGRTLVNEFLQVKGTPDIFALGDWAVGEGASGAWPMLAQAAVASAKVVAHNVVNRLHGRPLRPFRFRSKGVLVSIGRWHAVGEIFGVAVRGRLVWLLWHLVYWTKFLSWPKRFKLLVDWFLNVFRARDLSTF
ncbi:MAG: NAD(P)/FAD-dependent oxidoreductase [Patescibacteria group bacterium]